MPSLRAGVFYDPEPASGRKSAIMGLEKKGSGKPDDYYGFSLGGGLLIMKYVNVDLAYVFRYGKDVRKDTFGQDAFNFSGTGADVISHNLYLSTVIYF
jgi:hypothetical protein